jgi:hypothetical protein
VQIDLEFGRTQRGGFRLLMQVQIDLELGHAAAATADKMDGASPRADDVRCSLRRPATRYSQQRKQKQRIKLITNVARYFTIDRRPNGG